MARAPADGLPDDIRALLHSYQKGLSIEEISSHLSISRTTTAKYLNAMEQTGQIESRPYGPAKVYTLTERIPIDNIFSLLPHLILILDDSFTIRKVNDTLLDFFHLQKNDLIGKNIRYSPLGSYVDENKFDVFQQAMGGNAQSFEEDITMEDSTTFFYVRIVPTIFEKGRKGIVLIFEDITAQKLSHFHLEEQVRERTAELKRVNKKLCDENEKHRKVREQLAFKDYQLEQLVESSTDLILKFSSEGVLIFFNSTAGNVLGIESSKEKKYKFIGTCVPDNPSYHEFSDSLILSLTTAPSIIRKKEIEYIKDGKNIWISWTFRSITSKSTPIIEILCIGTDITDRILNERRLIESERHLSSTLSHLPDPTFVIDPNRKILIWNKAMEEMTGMNAEDVVGKERAFYTPSIFGYSRPILADLIFDPDNKEYQSYFQNLSREEEVLTAETKGIYKSGEKAIFWVKVTPLKDENGQIIGAIQSMRDITSIRSLESSLIQSEELVRGILEASKDLIVVLNHKKCYVYANSAYEKIFHYRIEELKGKNIIDTPLPGDSELWNSSIDSLIQTRLSNRMEIFYSDNSGKYWLDCYLVPFFPKPKGEMHILLEIRDVTRLKGEDISLWEDEVTLQEIGKQVSRLIPKINLMNCIATIPLIAIFLMAFIGNCL